MSVLWEGEREFAAQEIVGTCIEAVVEVVGGSREAECSHSMVGTFHTAVGEGAQGGASHRGGKSDEKAHAYAG